MTIFLLKVVQVIPPAGTREPQRHLTFLRSFDLPGFPPLPFHIEIHKPIFERILITDVVFQADKNRFVCYQGWENVQHDQTVETIQKFSEKGWTLDN
jgi:hypothetical protein